MPKYQRRVDRVLEPSYLTDLSSRPIEELRVMQRETSEVETEFSYVRRLAHARMEILRAELDRRATGGSLSELIAALPQILAGTPPRPAPGSSGRFPQALAPSPDIKWQRGLERLIADDSLAKLPDLSVEEIQAALADLGTLETEVSSVRRNLHAVMDAISAELVIRHTAERA